MDYRKIIIISFLLFLSSCSVFVKNENAKNFGTGLEARLNKLFLEKSSQTKFYIESYMKGKDASAVNQNILRNQNEIADEFGFYYGKNASWKLSVLLKEHIDIQSDVVKFAKEKDAASYNGAVKKWQNNANAIAGFLSGLNPNLNRQEIIDVLSSHLLAIQDEINAQMSSDRKKEKIAFSQLNKNAELVAEKFSEGIIKQFPEKVR